MKTQNYEIRIRYSSAEGDECYVAQVMEMPGIMAHGDTPEAAAKEIGIALEHAFSVAKKHNDKLPTPRSHAASLLGRTGGKVTSLAKVRAARANGSKGGRPRTSKLLATTKTGT